MKIAIIGAGMAGLSCADVLAQSGFDVALFDKGRGPGGRMSTRRVETPIGQVSFDHGAQYFTVRDSRFARLVADWAKCGVAARWPEAGSDTWVGVPTMNAVIRHMAARHNVEYGFHAKALIREAHKWRIVGETGSRGGFDAIIMAMPAEQAASILSLHDFAMARSALLARSQPCWTAMYAFAGPVSHHGNLLKEAGPITWAVRNNSKPGRPATEAWVVQANATWSSDHLEASSAFIVDALKEKLEGAVGAALPDIAYSTAHRWRYALSSGTGLGSIWNENLRLGVCGDWLLGPRVECAFLSGQALALQLTDASALLRLTGQPVSMHVAVGISGGV